MSQPNEYLLIGHVTADLLPDGGRLLGGTVSYSAPVVRAFGWPVRVLTSAATGEPLLDQLKPLVDDLVVLSTRETSTFENIYSPTGRTQYIRGVASHIRLDDVPPAWMQSPLIHLAPLTGEVDPDLARAFKQANPDSIILLTLQGWLRQWDSDGRVRFKRWFDADVLQYIDIVVFSEEDILEAPDLEALFAQSTRYLFVTRAERGGTYYINGQRHEYSTPQVEVVSPTGAGDVFAAALLSALPHVDNDVHRAVKVAAALAAQSTTRIGLDSAPSPDAVKQVLSQA
jgi:1D-myo-inositol 3-kinase